MHGPGSIVVFHDSEKAFPRMEKALPESLKYFIEQGFRFEAMGGNVVKMAVVKISRNGNQTL